MLQNVLAQYGLTPTEFKIVPFGSGLINHTWKVSGKQTSFILQRINTNVFLQPYDITNNLHLLADFLQKTAPNYIFAAPLPTTNENYLVELDGQYFRLLPFIDKSHTINFVTQSTQAYEAALQFGKLTALLTDFDVAQLKFPIPDFHNLSLRIIQFKRALICADKQRLSQAQKEISKITGYLSIAEQYEHIKRNPDAKLRVIHHDTKINNVLFDDAGKGLAVVDLDTIMPGYFISDVGDMMRTYLSEANEEEQDLKLVTVSKDFFAAVYKGYMEAMDDHLTSAEKVLFIYSGKFIIYMQAVRFLTDYLNNDIYYPVSYTEHNLMRAKNQLKLLEEYILAKPAFEQIMTNPKKVY